MDLTINGGTPQQVAWVNEAIGLCTYPLNGLSAKVTVEWAAVTNCHTPHTYMCTTLNADGTFTIQIEPWADDPNNHNNRDLPAGSIKDFYMQSFVHELGHVVHYSLITTDASRALVAGYFWIPDISGGPGRRWGTLNDYSTAQTPNIAWANEIVEAIAECFKVAFFGGNLLFMNRTNWRIDEQEWGSLWTALTPPASPEFDETWQTDFPGLTQENVVSNTNGVITPGNPGSLTTSGPNGYTKLCSKIGVPTGQMASVKIEADDLSAGGYIEFAIQADQFAQQLEGYIDVNGGSPESLVVGGWDATTGNNLGNVNETITVPPTPFWVVARPGPLTLGGEIWTTDPWQGGGSPLYSLVLPGWTGWGYGYSSLALDSYQAGTLLTAGEWRHGTASGGSVNPPYPFALVGGEIHVGPSSSGYISLG